MKLWLTLTGLAALVFCGTSMLFTVGLFAGIPGEPAAQWIAGLTAGALELCKFSFAPLGLWLRAQGRALGYVLLTLWPALVLVSIAATVGFLASHTAAQQHLNASGTLEYQTLQRQLASVDQQIETLNGVIAIDAGNGYRQRAINTAEQLEQLEAQRSAALAQIKTVRESAPASAQATFTTLANLTHGDAEQWQHAGFVALAVIADVVGLVALLAFNSALTLNASAERQPQRTKRQPPTVQAAEHSTDAETLNAAQRELAQRIRRGEFGGRPALRQINRLIRGGNKVVRPVFEYLENNGELKRDGQGFALASN